MSPLLALLAAALTACAPTREPRVMDEIDHDATFEASAPRSCGGIVLVHGLNTAPAAMDPLALALAERGFTVRRVALDGHYGPSSSRHGVTAEAWLGNVDRALGSLRERFEPSRVHVVGFSLGGAIPLVLAKRGGEAPFSRAVLVAPAISIGAISAPLRSLSRITRANIPIPSFAPRELRAYDSTSLAEYRALFELSDELARAPELSSALDVPTLVLVSPDDALVSEGGIRSWVEESGLSNWRIENIAASKRTHLGHVIFHPRAFEEAEWNNFVDRIAAHLAEVAS